MLEILSKRLLYLSVNSHSGRESNYQLNFIQDMRGLNYLIFDI